MSSTKKVSICRQREKMKKKEGGKVEIVGERERERGREGGRERGREGGRDRERERRREGGRENEEKKIGELVVRGPWQMHTPGLKLRENGA